MWNWIDHVHNDSLHMINPTFWGIPRPDIGCCMLQCQQATSTTVLEAMCDPSSHTLYTTSPQSLAFKPWKLPVVLPVSINHVTHSSHVQLLVMSWIFGLTDFLIQFFFNSINSINFSSVTYKLWTICGSMKNWFSFLFPLQVSNLPGGLQCPAAAPSHPCV